MLIQNLSFAKSGDKVKLENEFYFAQRNAQEGLKIS